MNQKKEKELTDVDVGYGLEVDGLVCVHGAVLDGVGPADEAEATGALRLEPHMLGVPHEGARVSCVESEDPRGVAALHRLGALLRGEGEDRPFEMGVSRVLHTCERGAQDAEAPRGLLRCTAGAAAGPVSLRGQSRHLSRLGVLVHDDLASPRGQQALQSEHESAELLVRLRLQVDAAVPADERHATRRRGVLRAGSLQHRGLLATAKEGRWVNSGQDEKK